MQYCSHAPAVSLSPAPVVQYVSPAPAVSSPAPVVEFISPASAVHQRPCWILLHPRQWCFMRQRQSWSFLHPRQLWFLRQRQCQRKLRLCQSRVHHRLQVEIVRALSQDRVQQLVLELMTVVEVFRTCGPPRTPSWTPLATLGCSSVVRRTARTGGTSTLSMLSGIRRRGNAELAGLRGQGLRIPWSLLGCHCVNIFYEHLCSGSLVQRLRCESACTSCGLDFEQFPLCL